MKPTELEMRRIKMRSEEKEVRAILARDFSASRMSATKWRETLQSLNGLAQQTRVQFVDVADPLEGGLDIATDKYFDGTWGPVLTLSVEWLEVDPIEKVQEGLLKPRYINHGEEVERRLQEINVPYQWVEDRIRIIGHVRNA